MSTYYYFTCDECRETGGFFSRQAWGRGNANILDTFRFLYEHGADHPEKVRIIDEHDNATEDYDERKDKWYRRVASGELDDYFPRSHEWEAAEKTHGAELVRFLVDHEKKNASGWIEDPQ